MIILYDYAAWYNLYINICDFLYMIQWFLKTTPIFLCINWSTNWETSSFNVKTIKNEDCCHGSRNVTVTQKLKLNCDITLTSWLFLWSFFLSVSWFDLFPLNRSYPPYTQHLDNTSDKPLFCRIVKLNVGSY